jgi:hypothetical protein
MVQQWFPREDEMKIPGDVFPAEVQSLHDELLRRGYATVEELYDEASFGNALLVLERDSTFIRLLRDRGQWFVGVAEAPGSHGFAPVIWHAFLESSMPSLKIPSFEEQAQWLLADLPRIELVLSDFTEKKLADLQAWRSRRVQAREAVSPAN